MPTRAGLDARRSGLVLAGAFAVLAAIVGVIGTVRGTNGELLIGLLGTYGALMYTFVGVVVLWRRPRHGIGRLAVAIGLAFAISVILTEWSAAWHPTSGVQSVLIGPQKVLFEVAGLVSTVLLAAGMVLGVSLLVTWFPDGHRTSRLGGLVELVLIVSAIAIGVAALRDPILAQIHWSPTKDALFSMAAAIGTVGVAVAYGGAFLDLGLRYRLADVVRRTQMRWVWAIQGLSIAVLVCQVALGDRFQLFGIWLISLGLPVLAIAIAITRYHLYDIDRIVSRSISYLGVTAVLVVVFGSTILILQGLINVAVATPGTNLDPRVVAISTLVVAALFNPLRARIQSAVDRRFHRERYDAAQLVAGFSGRLRDQLDLSTVSAELRATTVRALEPATTGVWLRGRGAPRR